MTGTVQSTKQNTTAGQEERMNSAEDPKVRQYDNISEVINKDE